MWGGEQWGMRDCCAGKNHASAHASKIHNLLPTSLSLVCQRFLSSFHALVAVERGAVRSEALLGPEGRARLWFRSRSGPKCHWPERGRLIWRRLVVFVFPDLSWNLIGYSVLTLKCPLTLICIRFCIYSHLPAPLSDNQDKLYAFIIITSGVNKKK